jgi:hypothetical protein
MFHVEHMKMQKSSIYLLFILLFLSSCTKKIANPEKLDQIYLDLVSELDISAKQETELSLQLSKDVEAFRKTPPQTGAIANTRTKMAITENLLSIVKQQKKFFEIRIEQRKNYVESRYNESLTKNGRPWPDLKETEDYKIRMKLQRDKFNWETNNVPRGTNKPTDKQKPAEKSTQ